MPLLFESRIPRGSATPIDFSSIRLDQLIGQDLATIGQARIFHGNREIPVAELFDISGDSSDGQVNFRGNLSSVHGIGSGMTRGAVRIEDTVGRHLGAAMRGGQIEVFGDTGDWLGAEMHGGQIRVHGSAGDRVGAAYPGSLRGMRGGEILIDGDVGQRLGERMRRGLIAVRGGAAGSAGVRMIAGTILIGGACGPSLCAGMRRGTMILTGNASELADHLPLTFVRGSRANPSFVRLLSAHLEQSGFDHARDWIDSEFTIYHGDWLSLGKAEILARA